MASTLYAVVDGHEVDLPSNFNDLPQEEQQSVIDRAVADVQSRNTSSGIGAFARKAADSFLMNAYDEIAGTVTALTPKVVKDAVRQQALSNPVAATIAALGSDDSDYKSVWDGDEPVSIDKFKRVRDDNIDETRRILERDSKSQRLASGAGTVAGIAGSFAVPVGGGAGLLARAQGLSKGARVAAGIGGGTAAGGALGAAAGYMSGESPEERADNALDGSLWGAGAGLVLGTGGQVARAGWERFVSKPRLYKRDPVEFANKYIFKPGMSESAKRNTAHWGSTTAKMADENRANLGEPGLIGVQDALEVARAHKDGLIQQIGHMADPGSRVVATNVLQSAGKLPKSELLRMADDIKDPSAQRAVKDFVDYYTDVMPGLRGSDEVETGKDWLSKAANILPSNSPVVGSVINRLTAGKAAQKRISKALSNVKKYPEAYRAVQQRLGPAPIERSREDIRKRAIQALDGRVDDAAGDTQRDVLRRAAEDAQMRRNAIQQNGPAGAFVPPKRGVNQSDEAYRSDKLSAFNAYRRGRAETSSRQQELLDQRWADAQRAIREARTRRLVREAQPNISEPPISESQARSQAVTQHNTELMRREREALEAGKSPGRDVFIPPKRSPRDTDDVYAEKVRLAEARFNARQKAADSAVKSAKATGRARAADGATKRTTEVEREEGAGYSRGVANSLATQNEAADLIYSKLPEKYRHEANTVIRTQIERANSLEAADEQTRILLALNDVPDDVIEEIMPLANRVYSLKRHKTVQDAEAARFKTVTEVTEPSVVKKARAGTNKKKAEKGA